jgi:hypothetical protein
MLGRISQIRAPNLDWPSFGTEHQVIQFHQAIQVTSHSPAQDHHRFTLTTGQALPRVPGRAR